MSRYQPVWQHTQTGLVLRVGHRAEPVPEPLDEWLIGQEGVGASADAADDLLRLEGRLRALLATLVVKTEKADRAVAAARAQLAAAQTDRGWRGRRAAKKMLDTAIIEHTATVETLEDARTLLEVLREFVLQLEPEDGPLREAAEGWSRSAVVPTSVVVFNDEEHFLTVDPRRERDAGLGYSTIAGDTFGTGWRRDGDDDDPDAETTYDAGPWVVGYIPRTGEIYASRHSTYLDGQVWLLGKGFDDADAAHALLAELQPMMRQPNSLIAAADRVHAARRLDGSDELACPTPRAQDSEPVVAGPASATPGDVDADADTKAVHR